MSVQNRKASSVATLPASVAKAIDANGNPTTIAVQVAIPAAAPTNEVTDVARLEHIGRLLTNGRDIVRETERWAFYKQLWIGTHKVEGKRTVGDPGIDLAVTGCWGDYAAEKHYPTPWDGQAPPVDQQIAASPVKEKIVRVGGNETVSEDGQKSIDLIRSFPEYATATTTRDWSMEYPKGSIHAFPSGTRLSGLTDKNLARLIWAVRESLPRVLSGKDRDKYARACAILLGRYNPLGPVPTVEGVDPETVAKVLAMLGTKK